MRISTNTIYQSASNRLSDLQVDIARTQQQLSTSKRILVPSDDPVGTARALDISQSQSANSQFTANRQTVKNSLTQVDSVLSGVTTLLQDVKVATVAAGNAALTDTDRASLATNLRGRFEELLGLANATDGAGSHLFAGYQTATTPFVANGGGAAYMGDQGQRLLQVDTSRQVALSDSGQNVFQSGTAQDVFKTLNDLINLLQTPVTGPVTLTALSTGLSTANNNIDASINNVLSVRESVGARLGEMDSLDTSGSARDLQYQTQLSQIQDIDYSQAITKFSQQQVILQAAQQSFLKMTSLSLFNFL